MRWMMVAGLVGLGSLGAVPAQAGLLGGTGDFQEVLDLPAYNSSGARVLRNNGAAIDGSVELSAANEVSNPSGWTRALNASLGDLVLTLTPDSSNTYQTITFTVSDILAAGTAITGFVQTGFGAIDAAASSPYTETLSYTANALTVSYVVNDVDGHAVFQLSSTGQDSFAITTAAVAAAVPEPASLAILPIGLALVAWRRPGAGRQLHRGETGA